jgi:Type ISP C-terminal specificity domain/N-6 DNA Methylase
VPDAKLSLDSAVSTFGLEAKAKLSAVAVKGEPEDQLRNPLEHLVAAIAKLSGQAPSKLALIGESSLSDLHTRPDFAVSYANALIGFIEVKAPGKGADPRKFKDPHDKEQWKKLAALPNLVYTDGNSFSLWRDGSLVGNIQRLDGDIETSGADLKAAPGLLVLFESFLKWSPIPPETPRQLAQTSARLCRLLRDEVAEQLDRGDKTLTGLANDWRHLLFPGASNAQFADGYAQAVTFGLLLAREQGISLDYGIGTAAKKLSGSNSLIGHALRVLTDSVVQETVLPTSVSTLGRVLSVVDWHTVSKGNPDAWLYFYEEFLAVYDNALRKRTGSYYTPVEVVKPMTRMVDEALRARFGFTDGLANSLVTLVDPAMGTGTFLLEVLRSLAETVSEDQGEGAVGGAVDAALSRIIGFEIQLGPFAVAQLRLLAEVAQLGGGVVPVDGLQTYVTNTLDNPFVEDETLGMWYEPIARSRREANKIKKDRPVLVVIGNPPYRERSHGQGAWIESGNPQAGQLPPLDRFIPPADWGVGAHVKHLYNPYVYFWRWATWKVFDHHPSADRGVVCFISVAGFLDGPGFQRMREYLRRRCDAIWVIDCSPEGHQPAVSTRIFEAVQQPVCIVMAIRDRSTTSETPAITRFHQLAEGSRFDKFGQLADLSFGSAVWESCPDEWRAPFLPVGAAQWMSFPALDDLLGWSGSGTMAGRTWVVAPDRPTLEQRWKALTKAKNADKPGLFLEHPTDRRVDTVLSDGLPGFPATKVPIGKETGPCPDPVRIGYRSFDRQWIIPDKRLINRPNPALWSVRGPQQLYLTAPHDTTPTSGPGATFTAEVPDLHHYHGRGGRAFPLWLDAVGTEPNIVPGLLDYLSERYASAVSVEDLFAYLAAVLSHPGYTSTFAEDLKVPGLRVPLTADPQAFSRAVTIGKRVLWLHSYGQRFHDEDDNRPKRSPRLPDDQAPRVLGGYPIPGDAERMPDGLAYDPEKRQLGVGAGRISNVTPRMRQYEVSGVNVLDKWFGYRRKNRERPPMPNRRSSSLEQVQSSTWRVDYTSELVDLLHVLGLLADLEAEQAELLDAIIGGPLISVHDLESAQVLPVPSDARKAPKVQHPLQVDQPEVLPGM